jgi:hypothetical protein
MSADLSSNQPAQPAGVTSGSSKLNPKWLAKHGIIAALCTALGLWGVFDAIVAYPQRGVNAAEFLEYQYLKELEAGGTLSSERASIANPAERLNTLRAKAKESSKLTPVERAELDWLTQLRYINKLAPANTAVPRTDFRKATADVPASVGSAVERLSSLRSVWEVEAGGKKKRRAANPLSSYDIPSQWLIAGAGALGGLWFLTGILKAKGKKYSYDAGSKTLTLPDGRTISAAEVAEFDKSKWHKYYIRLVPKASSSGSVGKPLDLDLLTHTPLEDWVLDMERAAGLSQ